MLEIRYNKVTKEVSGWCGDTRQFGNLKLRSPDEVIEVLSVPIPPKGCTAYLLDNGILIDNPNYVEPIERDPFKEIEKLRGRVQALEKGSTH